MASDDLWILGIHMTKFGKHPDQDVVDLAAEAALAALAGAGEQPVVAGSVTGRPGRYVSIPRAG